MKTRTRRNRRKGFTLMEVMLVLAILIIMASLATYSIMVFQRNAQADAAKLQISGLARGCEAYQLDVGSLPNQLQDLITRPGNNAQGGSKWRGPYLKMSQIPNDPWNNAYEFDPTYIDPNSQLPTALIRSNGPDRQKGTQDDISNIETAQ